MRRAVYVAGLIAVLACAARPTAAHEAPVPVNRMQLTVDHGRLILRFHSAASWWVLNVLNEVTPPPTRWPESVITPLKTYFDTHVVLRADGKPLPSTLTWGRYSEEVWRYYLGSQLDLTLEYPLPAQAQTVSGNVTLYKEESDQPPSTFHTTVRFFGPAPHEVALDLQHPTFSTTVADLTRTPAQRIGDQWRQGIDAWETLPWVMLMLTAVQLQIRTRLPSGARWGVLGIVAAITGAVAAVKRALGPGYALGIVSILLIAVGLIESALRIYHGRLVRVSESQADALFATQTRFLSFLIGGIALLLFAETVAGPA